MELRHLRYFLAAAEEENFGRASERLHVTRPAVSQLIGDLEGELGLLLFERVAHGVKLSAAGRTLLPRVRSVMTDLDDAFNAARLVSEGKGGSLSIGYGSVTLMHTLFREAVKQFHERYPEVNLSLVELPSPEQQKALADGRIQAGFMHFGPGRMLQRKRSMPTVAGQDETVLDCLKIQSSKLGAAVPANHRLARRKSVAFADLSGEDFVVVPHSSFSPGYGPLFTLCQQAGFEPRIVQEVQTATTQINLISVGLGIGLIMTGRGFAYPPGVRVIPLEGVDYPTEFVLGWVKGRKDPALDSMIGIVKRLASGDPTE